MKYLKAIALSLLGVLAVQKSALAINLYIPPEEVRTSTLYFEDKVTQAGLFYCNFTGKDAAITNTVFGHMGYYINLRNKPQISSSFRNSSVGMTVSTTYGTLSYDMSASAKGDIIEKSRIVSIRKKEQVKVGFIGDIYATDGKKRITQNIFAIGGDGGLSLIGELNCPKWDYPDNYNNSDDLFLGGVINRGGGVQVYYNNIVRFYRTKGLRVPSLRELLKFLK